MRAQDQTREKEERTPQPELTESREKLRDQHGETLSDAFCHVKPDGILCICSSRLTQLRDLPLPAPQCRVPHRFRKEGQP
jgi:hypothetical protein